MPTLRRELRIKFEDILARYSDKLTLPEREPLAELLADSALEVSGIRRMDKGDIIAAANLKVDAILDLANAPGIKAEARRNAILSYLGERLHVNTETKAWREFAKYADGQQQKGEKIEAFIAWLFGQDGFQIQYWPPRRMQEFWPMAFVVEQPKRAELRKVTAQEEVGFVPNPYRRQA